MTQRRLVAKEVRALLPLWVGGLAVLGCLVALRARTAVSDGLMIVLGMLICGGASVALGALSIGHEYAHQTLASLLSQPASRGRLFLTKQSVLGVMLLILAEVAWVSVFYPSGGNGLIVGVSVLCGLCLAPLLTMITRNPVAGIVFTIAVPGMAWLPVDWLVARPLKLTAFWTAMVALCAVAAALGWRTFKRLEVTTGRGPHVFMRWSSPGAVVAPAQPHHPLWWLVKKELGLQQMTFVVVAIYLLGSLGILSHVTDVTADVHAAITAMYSGVLVLLIGSLASAEERQLGVLESQLLLPMAFSTQWMAKIGITVGLSLLLAVGLPALLIVSRGGAVRINEWYACAILILAVTSLYVSSLCSTGIRALLLSVLATPVVLLIAAQFGLGSDHLTMSQAVMLAGFLTLVLWFGLENHRSAERGAARIGRQVFVVAGCLALGGVFVALL
jgi:hypothetical protein